MESILDLVIMISVSLIILILGLLIWKKEKIGLIHSYHYKNVKKEDVGKYTRLVGIGICVLSVGIIIGGVIGFLYNETISLIIILFSLVMSLLILNKAQKTFNNGWF